jgi:hypothetical protein
MSSPPDPGLPPGKADLTDGSLAPLDWDLPISMIDSYSPPADVGSSDDILIEDMESGLRAVQTVTEQLNVEEESITLIQLISRVETAVKTLDRAPKKGRGFNRPHSAKSNNEAILAILNDTLRNVQELHIATIQRQVKRSVVTVRLVPP